MSKTFGDLKIGDYIYVKNSYFDDSINLNRYKIEPYKIVKLFPMFSLYGNIIIIIAKPIDLNCINSNEVEFSILDEEYKSSICGNSFSTSYEELKEVCALQELQERINNRNILATSTQAINLRFRN